VRWQLSDWIIMAIVTMLVIAATVYLFIHPSESAFLTWGGIVGTITSVYHWLVVHDSKVQDASPP
jgi:hypothetical protein